MELVVPKVEDFEVTGEGKAEQWSKAQWQDLTLVGKSSPYRSRFKIAYSVRGIYVLFDCEDRRLTCTMTQDFDDIYREDVVEAFLWPDERQDVYFEYEISPLGVQLPILIVNDNGTIMGWRPWHYTSERQIHSATSVRNGEKASMAEVAGWSAEVFIPFALLTGLHNSRARSEMRWRANFYRIDYDSGEGVHWAWCPATGKNFHNFRRFGTILFE